MNFFKKYWDIFAFPGLLFALFCVLRIFEIGDGSIFELLGILFSMTGMSLTRREMPIGHLMMLAGQILFLFYFIPIELWGQVVFCIIWGGISLVGFLSWRRQTNGKTVSPSYMKPVWYLPLLLGLTIIVIFEIPNGAIGITDWGSLFLGVTGQLALVKKKIQGWGMWILKDLMSIVLFALTGSYILLARAFMFLYTDITASIEWKRKINK